MRKSSDHYCRQNSIVIRNLCYNTNSISRTWESYTVILAFAFLLQLIVGTAPFSGTIDNTTNMTKVEGDKLQSALLVCLFLLALPIFACRRKQVRKILLSSQSTLLIMGWAAASVLWSDVMAISARHFSGTMVVACLTLLIALLPPRRTVNVLLAVTGVVMSINYVGLILIPGLAEFQDFWLGLHQNKNLAGYVGAIAALLWLFVGGVRKTRAFLVGGILCLIFCWRTGSQTSFILMMAMIPIGLLFKSGLKHGYNTEILAALLALAIGGIVPLAIMMVMIVNYVGMTFDGRSEVWQFVWSEIHAPTFLFGVGYSSFWGIGEMSPAVLRGNSFVAHLTHSHNGYLDVLISLGFVGLSLVLLSIAGPYRILLSYRREETDVDTREAILCALLMLTFGIFHNCFESNLLQGLNLTWTLMLLSIWMITPKADAAANVSTERVGMLIHPVPANQTHQ